MDTNKEFAVRELVGIGIVSGIAVTFVKLIQSGFLIYAASIEVWAAVFTYLTYMGLGAIGAVFLVDHDAKGQKMFKSAFLMGLVAPSFFLAVISHPVSLRGNPQDVLKGIPKIGDLLIPAAHAQQASKDDLYLKKEWGSVKHIVLDKTDVQPAFGSAIWMALGGRGYAEKYAYVIGATEDGKKAAETAVNAEKLLVGAGFKAVKASVVQPRGMNIYYVTLGEFGTADSAADVRTKAIGAAVAAGISDSTQEWNTTDAKRAAALLVSGRVVDGSLLFYDAPKK